MCVFACVVSVQQLYNWNGTLPYLSESVASSPTWAEKKSTLNWILSLILSSMLPPWPMSLSYLEPDLHTKPMCMQDATVQVVYTRESQTIWNQVFAV